MAVGRPRRTRIVRHCGCRDAPQEGGPGRARQAIASWGPGRHDSQQDSEPPPTPPTPPPKENNPHSVAPSNRPEPTTPASSAEARELSRAAAPGGGAAGERCGGMYYSHGSGRVAPVQKSGGLLLSFWGRRQQDTAVAPPRSCPVSEGTGV